MIRERPYDLYIFDYLVPDTTADRFCEMLRRAEPNVPIVIYSGFSDLRTREAAIRAGADLFLVKPNDLDRLCPSVDHLLDHCRAQKPASIAA